jgi:hypothetical protein
MMGLAVKFGGSLAGILALWWLSRMMGLGGDVRIRDDDHAKQLADQAVSGFRAVAVARDKAGIGALLRDANGQQMLLRRNGAHFIGRLLDSDMDARLDQNFLTVGSGETMCDSVTLNLGEQAQYWAAGLRHLPRA